MSRGRAMRLCAALATAAPIGCTAVGPDSPPFEVLSIQPATESLAAETIYPLTTTRWTYETAQRGGAIEPVIYRRLRTKRFGAAWVTHQGNERSEFCRLDDDRNVVMTAVISHVDRALSLFQPPLIVAYRDLPPGEVRQHEVAMRVVDARNPSRQRESGKARRTIQYVGDYLIRTPMGEMLTKRVDVSFTADLQFADANTTTVIYVAKGLGPVVEQRMQVVRILGLSARRRHQTLLLTSKSPEDSGSP